MRPMCDRKPNFIDISQTVSETSSLRFFFQNGGRPPSWMHWTGIGATHEQFHLESMQCLDNIFCIFNLKWSTHAPTFR